jgi:2-C-methyl-D-erythritol 4-phosphate cytidylyltransferase
MGAEIPKQYLALSGRNVLEHTLARLMARRWFQRIIVVISQEDEQFSELSARLPAGVETVYGGRERYHSVRNGLDHLSIDEPADALVAVHDAARPCITPDDIDTVLAAALANATGALLGAPFRDTVKRARGEPVRVSKPVRVVETVDRSELWTAFTPQVFRLAMLRTALSDVMAENTAVTDECQAIERYAAAHDLSAPVMVEGRSDNIKITLPEDLDYARFVLSRTLVGSAS